MKKILLSILGIFFGLSAFCSADNSCVVSDDFVSSTYSTTSKGYFIHFGLDNSNGIYTISGFSYFDEYKRLNLPGSYNGYLCYISRGSDLLLPDGNNYKFNCSIVENINNNITQSVISLPGFFYSFISPVVVDSSLYSDVYLFIFTTGSSVYSTVRNISDSFNFGGLITSTGFLNFTSNKRFYYDSGSFASNFRGLYLYSICFSYNGSSVFTVNYGNQSKEYEITSDVDIYINSPVSKDGSIFTYDGSTGINLLYNGQYNWYTKNKLYLDGQFWYRQGVFTPICL